MSGEFESGTVMWFWYNTFLVVPAAAAVVYLTVRSILWFPWTRRIELDDGERKRVLHIPALAVKVLSVAGAALVVLAALDRFSVELLSMNANAFGYASLIGAVFAAVFGLFAVVRARMTRGREEEEEDEEQAPEEAPQDVGIPGATQVFTRVRGAEAWLVTRSEDDSGSIIQMQGDNVSVGSEEGSGIRIGNETVEANHALIKVNQGHYSLFDLGSSNGTWINDNQVIGAVLRDGSRIAMGNSELFFTEVGGGSAVSDEDGGPPVSKGVLLVRSGPSRGKNFQLGDGDLIVGRQPGDGGARIDDPSVSQRHALLRPAAGGCHLFDLGSSNGTTVDDIDVAGHPLQNGDVVRFGQAEFQFVLEDSA